MGAGDHQVPVGRVREGVSDCSGVRPAHEVVQGPDMQGQGGLRPQEKALTDLEWLG